MLTRKSLERSSSGIARRAIRVDPNRKEDDLQGRDYKVSKALKKKERG